MRPPPDRPPPRPAGFSLIEATVAVVLLLAALSTAARALSWIARDRSALDRRAVAIREADNLLERLASGAEAEATPGLSPDAEAFLPDGSVEVDRAADAPDGLELERITVTVRYRDRQGMPAAPVRLTTWIIPTPSAIGEDAP